MCITVVNIAHLFLTVSTSVMHFLQTTNLFVIYMYMYIDRWEGAIDSSCVGNIYYYIALCTWDLPMSEELVLMLPAYTDGCYGNKTVVKKNNE